MHTSANDNQDSVTIAYNAFVNEKCPTLKHLNRMVWHRVLIDHFDPQWHEMIRKSAEQRRYVSEGV